MSRLEFHSQSLPIILQVETAECGLACIAMIASYHGHRLDLATVSQKFSTGLRGLTLADMIDIAARLNLSGRPLRIELTELSELSKPCILHWDLNHFVVLRKVLPANAGIIIHDPARGRLRLNMEEVSRHFTGVALELSPNTAFERKDERRPIRLRDVIGKVVGLRSSILQGLALALCLEVLAIISPLFMQLVVDNVIVTASYQFLLMISIGFFLLLLIQTAIALFRSWVVLYLSIHLNLQWLSNTFAHLMRLPISFFEKRHLGDVVSKFRAVESIQKIITSSFIEVVVDGLLSIAMLVMMVLYSPLLSLVVVVSIALYALLKLVFVKSFRLVTAEHIVFDAREQSLFLESIRALQAIRLFGQESNRRVRWQNAAVDSMNQNTRLQKMDMGFIAARSLLVGLENILVVALGAGLVIENAFSIGMLLAFVSYKSTFSGRVSSLIEKIFEFGTVKVQCERLSDIVLTPPEEAEELSKTINTTQLEMKLEIKNLYFRYSESEPWILNNLSLTVDAGESVAIVGPSGCGKTTLIKILLGLLKPERGTVLVGGLPIQSIGIRAYRELIGAVMQEDNLLAGSVGENICFFASNPDQDRIIESANLAGIHNEVEKMPLGYSSPLGDMGMAISGGQKQRILLARALYKKPKLLVLDEATSHLDIDRERLVNESIQNLRVTKVLVAHRLETINSAERVIKLLDGQVVSQ
jgi:ATP-binding cassette, subfamily B, bacterial CvaB/MchF/RaxB